MNEKFWDNEELIGTVNKENGDQIQIRKTTRKEKSYVDIRTYYMGKDDEFHPGKGICIPQELMKEIKEML